MKKILAILLSAAMIAVMAQVVIAQESEEIDYSKIRTVISTDLEIDDMDSLIHILLYANDFDIEA